MIAHAQPTLPLLKLSANHRYFATGANKPFFWLGDTGWLLFGKLTREEAAIYLEDRKQKGFNVIQVMLLHELGVVNVYGDSALINRNVATPKITVGKNAKDKQQYDYWDHVDYIIDLAASKGLYMALVPVWGGNVKSGGVNLAQSKIYAKFLAGRYKSKTNIIWLNGGDIKGSDSLQVWNTIGATLHENDPRHLITFHPRGRSTSSEWFHNEKWLDFNMFQSGHKDYAQDTTELRIGEDNWKFVNGDYTLTPVKPTMDGEPSYEKIPHGLHDTLNGFWTDTDVRRYAYWSVFAGGAGFTYGHNAVMQFYKPGKKKGDFFATQSWRNAINDPGASQMQYLKKLILSKPYFERVPDQSLVAGKNGERHDYILATRGKDYAFIYVFNGRPFEVNMGKIGGTKVRSSWYNPRDEKKIIIGIFRNKGVAAFKPPTSKGDGNDWVLIVEKV